MKKEKGKRKKGKGKRKKEKGKKEKRKKGKKENPGEIGRDGRRGGYIQLQKVLTRSWGIVCKEIDDNVTCLTQL